MKTITHYSLKWNLNSFEGQIILELKDDEGNITEKKLDKLGHQEFNTLAIILMKGKVLFDTTTNSISNIAEVS
jgi:hypothetical protein